MDRLDYIRRLFRRAPQVKTLPGLRLGARTQFAPTHVVGPTSYTRPELRSMAARVGGMPAGTLGGMGYISDQLANELTAAAMTPEQKQRLAQIDAAYRQLEQRRSQRAGSK